VSEVLSIHRELVQVARDKVLTFLIGRT